MSQIRIVNIEEQHCAQLEALQRLCFPTLGESELMLEAHFRSHWQIFPEGDFVALDGERVVGLGSGFFIDFDFENPDHSFQEIIAEGYYSNHDPNGDWYYGGDISVHPEYRGQGIGRLLYEARKDLVRRYQRKGIVAGGLIPGFVDYKSRMTAQEYVDKVVAGELYDSTLSFQLKNGFEVYGVIENYLVDSASDNWSSLIVWRADSA